MVFENITKEEVSEAIASVTRLKNEEYISCNVADILFRCLSVVSALQCFGEKKHIQPNVATSVSVPTIKMVPKEGAHIVPETDNVLDNYLSGGIKHLI